MLVILLLFILSLPATVPFAAIRTYNELTPRLNLVRRLQAEYAATVRRSDDVARIASGGMRHASRHERILISTASRKNRSGGRHIKGVIEAWPSSSVHASADSTIRLNADSAGRELDARQRYLYAVEDYANARAKFPTIVVVVIFFSRRFPKWILR